MTFHSAESQHWRSSIKSAPMSMPATIAATLPDALDPLSVGKCSRSPTMPCKRHDSANQVFQRAGRPKSALAPSHAR
jgi:hypothetical protein